MTSSLHNRAPLIETERLRLRAHTPADLDGCQAIWGDPEVVRHISGKPSTREESWSRMLVCAGLWSLLGYGFWLIEEKASGRTIGDIGLLRREREMTPPFAPDEIEAGWALSPSVQGRGYASEALQAVLAWADSNLDAPKIVCIINPDNAPSLKLAAKFGFVERTRATYQDAQVVQLERRPHV